MTLWYGEDDTVFVYEGDEVYVEQITVADFNSKSDELFNTTTSKEQYESYRDQIEKIIMDELVRDEREKKEYKNARSYAGSHDPSLMSLWQLLFRVQMNGQCGKKPSKWN